MHRFALPLLACLLSPLTPCMTPSPASAQRPEYAIVVHGGAGAWRLDDAKREAVTQAIEAALRAGQEVLAGGGSSLDAVERAVRTMEDAPLFNAGRGAVYNAEGEHMLDASIMSGRDRNAGAVANVRTVKNPITLARRVMEETRHVMFAGAGAEEFARTAGVEIVTPSYFDTEGRREAWERWKAQQQSEPAEEDHHGTVGCVALDRHGDLAAATSTGGITGKMFGRVGDSPIIGAGTFADNHSCAVSGTGVGELFMKNLVAYDIAARVAYGQGDLREAVAYQLYERFPEGTAGVIAVGADGAVVAECNTGAMPHGVADSTGRFEVAIEK